jgi:shikimate kinase
MDLIQKNGIIIWLYCPLYIIKKRLGDYSKRGIMMPDGITTLDELFEHRAKLYSEYADIELDTSKNSLDECVKIIQELLIE